MRDCTKVAAELTKNVPRCGDHAKTNCAERPLQRGPGPRHGAGTSPDDGDARPGAVEERVPRRDARPESGTTAEDMRRDMMDRTCVAEGHVSG